MLRGGSWGELEGARGGRCTTAVEAEADESVMTRTLTREVV